MYGGSSTHIPLKVNTGGVIPVIFASSILAFPPTLAPMFAERRLDAAASIDQLGVRACRCYNLLYVSGIIFFAYFYTAIIFNPDDVAENMRKYGGFVPGIRPGKRTAEYIDTILTRITLVGRGLPGGRRAAAGVPDQRLQGRADSVHRRAARRAARRSSSREGMDVHVLLRRHVAADHRRRRDGHRAAGRVAADHAALRRVHEEDAHPRAARAVGDAAYRRRVPHSTS